MKKKELKKLRRRNIIVIILFQLIISLFVGYWLTLQYYNEKKNVHLKVLYVRAMASNKLHQNIINSHQHDSLSTDDYKEITESPDSLFVINLNEVTLYTKKESKQFFEDYNQDNLNNKINQLNYINYLNSINKALKKAYKKGQFIRFQSLDSKLLGKRKNRNRSNLYTKLFDELISEQNLPLKHTWIPDSVSIDTYDNDYSFLRFNYLKNKFEVDLLIEIYPSQIIKNILPQIIIGFIIFCITALALIFALRGYNKRIKMNLLRRSFINNITHELKIPVSTAKIALEALDKYGLKKKKKIRDQYIKMMNDEMLRLEELTTRILNHAKLDEDQLQLNYKETNLNNLIETSLKDLSLIFKENNVSINFTYTNENITAKIDEIYFKGIINNLIDNSIKYGSSPIKIKINLEELDNKIKIIVSDNGPGIPKEYISKIFDSFFRVPNGNLHNTKGYGLGLSYAALVMKHHNGKIKARNIDKGCEFTLTLKKYKNEN